MNKEKKFDCVEMKQKIQAEIYEETRNLNDEQLMAYFRQETEEGPLAEKFRHIRELQEKREKKHCLQRIS